MDQSQYTIRQAPYLKAVRLAEFAVSYMRAFSEEGRKGDDERQGGVVPLRKNQAILFRREDIDEKRMPHAARPVDWSNVRHVGVDVV